MDDLPFSEKPPVSIQKVVFFVQFFFNSFFMFVSGTGGRLNSAKWKGTKRWIAIGSSEKDSRNANGWISNVTLNRLWQNILKNLYVALRKRYVCWNFVVFLCKIQFTSVQILYSQSDYEFRGLRETTKYLSLILEVTYKNIHNILYPLYTSTSVCFQMLIRLNIFGIDKYDLSHNLKLFSQVILFKIQNIIRNRVWAEHINWKYKI